MLHRTLRRLAGMGATSGAKNNLSPLEVFTQLQLGITPPLSVQRSFLLEHCELELEKRGITEAKLFAMDGRLCAHLLRQLVYEQYLAVPFRVYSFDMEFTGPPAFTHDGPTEDITELGLYSPSREEIFSCLVHPASGRKQGAGVTELTGITDEMLSKDGIPFVDAWQQFLDFVSKPEPEELPDAEQRILLLSHGGKLADVSLIKWTLEKFNLELPPTFVFGDTIHLIRDAHRRRPVTVDKHPPSWKLLDLVQWLKIPPTLPAHRAGNDAKLTWDALYHTLLRYGDDELTPREQLVCRFFDDEAKRRMRASQQRYRLEKDVLTDDSFYDVGATTSLSSFSLELSGTAEKLLDLDLDDIFSGKDTTSEQGSSSRLLDTEESDNDKTELFLEDDTGAISVDEAMDLEADVSVPVKPSKSVSNSKPKQHTTKSSKKKNVSHKKVSFTSKKKAADEDDDDIVTLEL